MNGSGDLAVIGPWEVAWACLMMAAVLALSLWQRLGLARASLVAAARTIVQLSLVGYVIMWVFKQETWYVIAGLLLLMSLVAGHAATGRVKGAGRRMRGELTIMFTLAFSAITGITLLYVTQVVLAVHRWDPQYLIPLGGLALGNAMNAGSLAAERMLSEIQRRPIDVETLLALGAGPAQAVAGPMRDAFRAAMIPVINAMTVVGIVTLPGVMTGQILGGISPEQAALYQIVVMFMVTLVNACAAAVSLWWIRRRIFTPHLQLRRLL
jgi:putative ABC transport system permease protein